MSYQPTPNIAPITASVVNGHRVTVGETPHGDPAVLIALYSGQDTLVEAAHSDPRLLRKLALDILVATDWLVEV